MGGKRGSRWNSALVKLIKDALLGGESLVSCVDQPKGSMKNFISYCNGAGIEVIPPNDIDPLNQLIYFRLLKKEEG
jgi:hypothetical protein